MDIEVIKQANDIAQVIAEDEPLQTGHGRFVRGLRHDSLVVDRRRQAYFWNSMGEWGDVIDWVMRHRRMEFREAIEYLARRAGLPAPRWNEQDAAAAQARRERYDVLTLACQYWQQRLWHNAAQQPSHGLLYARGRGWNDETIRAAMLGYVDDVDGLRGHLRMYNVDLNHPAAKAVLQAPPGMLVYPCIVGARVTYFMCRFAGAEKRHWNPPAEMLGERQPYFNHEYDRHTDAIVIVEGPADAISLAQWGIPAVALAGIMLAETESYMQLLAQLRQHRVVILGLDQDAHAATARIADALGPLTRIVEWPVHDANEWLQQGATAEQAQALLNAAPTWAEVTAERIGRLEGQERDLALRQAFTLFARAPEFELTRLKPQLCEHLGMSMRQFGALLRAAVREANRNNGHSQQTEPSVILEMPGGFVADHLFEMIATPPDSYQSGQVEAGWTTQFACRFPDGSIRVVPYLDISGVRIQPIPPTNRIITERVVLFPSELGERQELAELVQLIRHTIHRYVDVEPTYEALAAYYVLFTWVYDSFDTTAYLRVLGEAGSGKSRFLQVVGSMCYRPIRITGAATTSPIFRILDQYRGTLIADEMDFRASDEKADIIKIFNVGYQKEQGFVLRSADKNNGFATEVYVVYGPKVIATRRRFQDHALETRCITYETIAPTTRADIPLHLDRDFWYQESVHIRNLLLRFRLEHWQPEMRVDASLLDSSVEPRLNQVTGALQTIIQDVELRMQLQQFIRDFNAQMVAERGMTLTAKVLEAICGLWFMDLEDDHVPDLRIKRVAQAVNILLDEENEEDGQDVEDDQDEQRTGARVTAKKVGEIVRKQLQLATERRTDARRAYVVVYDAQRIEGLRRRFGITEEWLNDVIRTLRQRMGTHTAEPTTVVSKQGNLL